MKKIILNLIAITLLSFHSFGVEVEEVLKKMQANFSGVNQIEYNSTYELFKGHKSNTVNSSYAGYIVRSGTQVYQKIDETEFIYGKDFFLKISHSEKAVLLDLKQEYINQEIDMVEILKNCSSKTVEDFNGYYEITLKYKAAYATPFGIVKMRVEKSSYNLLQMDLYYLALQNFAVGFNKKDMAQPHLRIKFNEINMNPKVNEKIFSISNYILKKGNLLQPGGVCGGYELIDNRIK